MPTSISASCSKGEENAAEEVEENKEQEGLETREWQERRRPSGTISLTLPCNPAKDPAIAAAVDRCKKTFRQQLFFCVQYSRVEEQQARMWASVRTLPLERGRR